MAPVPPAPEKRDLDQDVSRREVSSREGEAPAEPFDAPTASANGSAGASPFPTPVPHRKHPAHGVLDADGQPTIVFGTVCTRHRQPWLANHEVHNLLRTVWRSADAWRLGRYVIMPDHIHFFAGWSGAAISFDAWVSQAFAHPDCRWQTDHWDTRMRNVTVYDEKWLYVRDNPRRHGLVTQPEDWPYQGEIYPLRWD